MAFGECSRSCAFFGDCEQRGSGVAGLLKNRGGAGCVDAGVDFFDIEKFAGLGLKFSCRECGQAKDETMGGQNYQAGAIHVDKSHHHPVVGGGNS